MAKDTKDTKDTVETAAEDQTYNGWTNYETWCVNLWLSNEENSYHYWDDRAKHWHGEDSTSEYWNQAESAKFNLADELKEWHEDRSNRAFGDTASVFTDLTSSALQDVDWQEIAAGLLSEYQEEYGS